MSRTNAMLILLSILVLLPVGSAQEVAPSVPLLIKHSGVLKDRLNRPVGEIVGLTFFIYKDREGGAPLWMETQNITPGADGSYSANLGASKNLPLELFASGETRWLSVQINLPGEEEQPRAQLVSVPFALKAAAAETLGGLPLSAFLLTTEAAKKAGREGGTMGLTAATALPFASVTGTGAANQVTKWQDTSGTLVDSRITDNGTNVGIGITNPNAPLHIYVPANTDPVLRIAGANTSYLSLKLEHPGAVIGFGLAGGNGSFFTTAVLDDAAVFGQVGKNLLFGLGGAEHMRVAGSGNVGIGTTTPGQKLDVGGNINASGSVTAASFSGGGSALSGLNASNLSSGTVANARTTATTTNTSNTIVLRDPSGNFNANTIFADGSGLSGLNASSIASGTIANARTTAPSAGTPNTIVSRDGSGNFNVGKITATQICFGGDSNCQTSACGVLYAPNPGATGRLTPAGGGAGGDSSACASATPLQQMLEEQRRQIQRLQTEVANLKQRLDALQPAKQ